MKYILFSFLFILASATSHAEGYTDRQDCERDRHDAMYRRDVLREDAKLERSRITNDRTIDPKSPPQFRFQEEATKDFETSVLMSEIQAIFEEIIEDAKVPLMKRADIYPYSPLGMSSFAPKDKKKALKAELRRAERKP